MTETRRLVWAGSAVLLLALSCPSPGVGEEDPGAAAPQTVVDVAVHGNRRMSHNAILAHVKTRVGQAYDEQVARDDQGRLLATGRFASVLVLKAQTDKGIVVTFSVTEHERISDLQFRGNKHFKAKKLLKQLDFGPDEPLNLSRIEMGRRSLADKYKEEGFYFVVVTVDEQALKRDRQVIYRIVEGPRIRVRKIVFQGAESFSGRKLRRQIKTRRGWWVFSRGRLDTLQLARDVVDLRNFYRGEGYLDAQVASDLKFSDDKKRVEVRFLVEEGPRYRVGDVRFQGNTVFADDELRRRLKMTRGQHHTALQLRRDTQTLRDTYGQIGYLDAVVTSQTLFVAPSAPAPAWLDAADGRRPALVVLSYEVSEGSPFLVGRVEIRGNDVTEDRVIRRQLRSFPGQLFNTVAVEDSRQRLMEGRLFSEVSITPFGQAPSVRDMLVSVQEGRTAEFVVGAGFSTNSGVVGTISHTQRNFSWTDWPESWGEFFRARAFKGAGQTMRMSIEPGVQLTRFRLDWREPYLMDRPVSLGTALYLFTRQREDYDERRVATQVSLGKLFKNRWYGEVTSRVENVRVDNLEYDAPPEAVDDKGDHLAVGFEAMLVRDRTDSRWMPSKGDRITLGFEQVIGDNSFGKARAGYRRYHTLHVDALERKHIFAARAEFDGVVAGDAPIFERYYGGGIGNVRGFDYRGISPRSRGFPKAGDPPKRLGAGKAIGGDMSVYLGAEYTFPLAAETLRGVVFLDSGTVEDDYTITTWRASTGVGIRLLVPYFGDVPMTLDFGFPITKDKEDDTQLVTFTFGWVF